MPVHVPVAILEVHVFVLINKEIIYIVAHESHNMEIINSKIGTGGSVGTF